MVRLPYTKAHDEACNRQVDDRLVLVKLLGRTSHTVFISVV